MDNDRIEEFKNFVKANPFLIGYIRRGQKSWQDVYEIYDLYGEDEEAWSNFLEEEVIDNKNDTQSRGGYWEEFFNAAKNVDVNKVQEGITSLQKTLGLFGELFTNKKSNTGTGSEYNPRPLYRRFED